VAQSGRLFIPLGLREPISHQSGSFDRAVGRVRRLPIRQLTQLRIA